MLLLFLQVATARPAAPTLTWDAIVDIYADAGSPEAPGGIRTWMTQPREDRSFALNLAAIGATWTADRVHARVAVQSGSSVVANYAGEPDPTGVRMIEEAYVGARAAERLWLDAGIFASAIGMESWRSTDDPTYTRSLTADYTPYYSAGIRGIWQASPTVALRLDLLNGWQRIGENNDAKAFAARADWTPHERLLIGGAAFVGNERPEGEPEAVRTFGQLYARVGAPDRTAVWLTGDLGNEDGSRWQSLTAIVRHPLPGPVAINLRGEYYADPGQVILVTGTANGFEGFGLSAGLDYLITPGVQWRTEGRWLSARDDVFADRDGGSESGAGFLVTALTFRW
jgi:hypothetical protein